MSGSVAALFQRLTQGVNLGASTVSRTVSKASALLHDHTVVVLTIIFCALVAATLWHLSRLWSGSYTPRRWRIE